MGASYRRAPVAVKPTMADPAPVLLQLRRHPESEGLERATVTVSAARRAGLVELSYRIAGAEGLDLPAAAPSERADELWQATCFELFVRAGEAAYDEFNFSPSTRWAAYGFTGYRDGRTDLEIPAPGIRRSAAGAEVVLDLSPLDLPEPWRVGVSTILQDTEGRRSFWALAHGPGKPDFHHPDAFALDLPVSELP